MKINAVMKNLFLFAFLSISFSAIGQTAAATEYKPGNEGWHVYLEEAYKESKETGKPILANFTGKDWCGWCKRLTASVFVHDEFKTWAAENVVLLELDYPRRTPLPQDIAEQNRNLQQAFQVRGYPTVWVFDLDKDDAGEYSISALGKTGYKKTVAEFTEDIDRILAN